MKKNNFKTKKQLIEEINFYKNRTNIYLQILEELDLKIFEEKIIETTYCEGLILSGRIKNKKIDKCYLIILPDTIDDIKGE